MKTTKRFLHWLFDDFLFSLYKLAEKKYTMGVINNTVVSLPSPKLFMVPTDLVPPVLPVNVADPTRLGSFFKMFGGACTSTDITTKVNPDTVFIQELHFQYTVRVIPAAPPGFVGFVGAPFIAAIQSIFVDGVDNTSNFNAVGIHSYQIPNAGTVFFTRTIKVLMTNNNPIPISFRYNTAQNPSSNKYFIYISTNAGAGLDNRITVSLLNAPNFPIGTSISAPTGSGATGVVVANNAGVLSINNMANGIFAVGDVLVGGLGPGSVTVFDPAITFIPGSATALFGGSTSFVGSLS